MPEGFLAGLHRHWILWSGWLFTLSGTVFGLAAGGAYTWIGALLALAGLLAVTGFAYQLHAQLREAEGRQVEHAARLRGEIEAAGQRATEAERRLNEVPADILVRLQTAIQTNAFADVAAILARHAEYVERMASLSRSTPKPVALRTFTKRGGRLYVEAKLRAEPMQSLRQDDPFILEYKDANDLVTASALLRVHQLNPAKEVAWFRVEDFTGPEMEHMDALAEKQVVPGKGYTARPVCDMTRYAGLELANLGSALRILTDEALRLQR